MVALRVDRARERLARVQVGAHGIRDPEDHRRDQEGDDGCREHADPRLVLRRGVVDREVDDEEGDREADAAQRGAAGDAVEREARPELAEPEQAQHGGGAEDADELADDEADDDAPGQRRR